MPVSASELEERYETQSTFFADHTAETLMSTRSDFQIERPRFTTMGITSSQSF